MTARARRGFDEAPRESGSNGLVPDGYQVLRPGTDRGTVRFTTETGSRYTVDLAAGTWSRIPTFASGALRTEGGPLAALVLGGIGRSAILVGPPLVPRSDARYVLTTPLVELDAMSAVAVPTEPSGEVH